VPLDPKGFGLSWRIGFAGVGIVAAILFFGRLGDRALWSEEVRWAEIPRGMAASGDYLWPRINGQTYYDKPLGSYWLVLGAAQIHGEVDETAARWPSAVAALLAVLVAMLIGRDLYGDRAGILAGLILATSFGFIVFARTAAADSENVAGILVALWLCLRNEDRGGGAWIIALWITMALTSLTKGLTGFILPPLIFGAYRLVAIGSRPFFDRQRWFFNWITLPAILIALTIYAIPFALSIRQSGSAEGLDMVWRENIRRFFDAHNHRGPVYLYLYVVFGLAAPWAVLLPAALVQAHVDRTRGDRFALAYFWSVFLFFTASSSRRSYYLLPIVPAVAFLVARLLTTPRAQLTPWARRLQMISGALVTLAIAAGAIALSLPHSLWPAPWDQLPPLPSPIFGALILGATAVIAVTWRMRALVVFVIGASAYLFLIAIPATEQYRTQKPFLAEVRARLGDDLPKLTLYRAREAIYYLNPAAPLAEFNSPDELRSGSMPDWLLARERDLVEIGPVGKVVLREPSQPWEAGDLRSSKLVLLKCR
jgi:4-amino-4-deoxy-L-arabinose transferase-like glycosyltransferase